jgi:hypothetical protein
LDVVLEGGSGVRRLLAAKSESDASQAAKHWIGHSRVRLGDCGMTKSQPAQKWLGQGPALAGTSDQLEDRPGDFSRTR